MKRTFYLLMAAAVVAACSTPTPPPPEQSPPQPMAAAPAPEAPPAAPPPAPTALSESPLDAFQRMRAGVAGDSVYFDFDRYAIKSDQSAPVSEHAKLATVFPRDQVTLQGNCDERGSREYNLALGQRRADAVKQAMVLMGVSPERIETISYGKEKPRAGCHDERCWAENRRADFVDQWK